MNTINGRALAFAQKQRVYDDEDDVYENGDTETIRRQSPRLVVNHCGHFYRRPRDSGATPLSFTFASVYRKHARQHRGEETCRKTPRYVAQIDREPSNQQRLFVRELYLAE